MMIPMPENSPHTPRSRGVGALAVAALVMLMAWLAGCNIIGYGAHVVAGDPKEKKVWHDAEYEGLDNTTVAVMVSADDQVLYQFPNAPLDTARAVSARLTADVTGVSVTDPAQVIAFQQRNPYWNATPYRDLLQRLNVQRIVHVDLVQYATHEPGNRHVWRGVVVANINVASADAPNPNDLVYANTVQVVFPEDRPVGVLDADDRTIQLGMLTLFSKEVSRLFHGHERVQGNAK